MNNNQTNSYDIYKNIENRIRNNAFNSKTELSEYIIDLKNRGILQSQENKEIEKLLNLYDELNSKTNTPLDMENYKSVSLEEKELILATEQDQILKTEGNHNDLENEFKQVQSKLIVENNAPETNSDQVFEYIANNQKEEATLLSMSEIFEKENIDIEMLEKIKYFIKNKYINPYSYKVDINEGIFYNIETKEVLEVRKDESTNEYKIYKGGTVVYEDGYKNEETLEEEKTYESRNKGKVRVLTPNKNSPYNNAAFSKIGFLILNIIIFITMICFIFFINK